MSTPPDLAFLAGDGEMAALIRAHDWDRTPLGAPGTWSPSLKAMVRLALTTRHPIFIFWGAEHLCLYNDAYRVSLGPEKHPRILGRTGREAWPEIWHAIGPQIDLVMRGEGATWHENQLLPIQRHGDLQDAYWTYSYAPIDEAAAPNGVGGVLVICTETTEQVISRRRATEERERFARLFEQAPTFMALLRGPHHEFDLVNPGYLRLVGHRPVLGRTVAEALPEAVEQGYVALLDDVYATGRAYSTVGAKFIMQSHEGGAGIERHVDFVYQPITDAHEQVTGIFVVGVDASNRREAEIALRESEDRFRLAIDAASLGTFDVDVAQGTVLMSTLAQALFDLPGPRATLDECFRRIHPDDVASVQAAVDEVKSGRGSDRYRVRHRVVGSDGGVRWLNVAGRIAGVAPAQRLIGVLWDITEQQQLLHDLRDNDRRKDEFLATLAHELRNPLAPIRTAATMLSKLDLAHERVSWCASLIERQSRTMALLLDDLLEVSRITRGRLVLNKAPVSVSQIVNAAVETARPLIDSKAHTLDVVLPPAPLELEADALRLSQVLTNLLANAAKFSPPGGRIRLEVQVLPGRLQFEVQDSGIGVAPAELPLLFRMFHQGEDALVRAQGGLGIGLAFSKGLIELHGGRIEASSAGLGQGTTFRVSLPHGDGDDGVSAAPAPSSTAPTRTAQRVLIVDDNVDAAETMAMFLEMEGCAVHVAHDGLAALAMAAEVRPEVAFLDIGMPGLDGYQLAGRLRTEVWGRGMLLVATTGWGQDEDKRRALAAGFDVHMTKPLMPAAVVDLLAARRSAPG